MEIPLNQGNKNLHHDVNKQPQKPDPALGVLGGAYPDSKEAAGAQGPHITAPLGNKLGPTLCQEDTVPRSLAQLSGCWGLAPHPGDPGIFPLICPSGSWGPAPCQKGSGPHSPTRPGGCQGPALTVVWLRPTGRDVKPCHLAQPNGH